MSEKKLFKNLHLFYPSDFEENTKLEEISTSKIKSYYSAQEIRNAKVILVTLSGGQSFTIKDEKDKKKYSKIKEYLKKENE